MGKGQIAFYVTFRKCLLPGENKTGSLPKPFTKIISIKINVESKTIKIVNENTGE